MTTANENDAAANGATGVGLGIDIGSSKLVAATLPLGDGHKGGLPVLVRNALSNDATPLAVVFGARLQRELGEAAIDTPASNAANLVSAFVPRLGLQGTQGACTIPSTTPDSDSAESLRLEQVLAMLLIAQTHNLHSQISLAASRHVLAVPPALATRPGGTAAVRSASRIAALEAVRVCTSTTVSVAKVAVSHSTARWPAVRCRMSAH
jgi:molecular chaperone DnaK (HSP70)